MSEKITTIVEVETKQGECITVTKDVKGVYEVSVNNVVRHPFCTAEDVMRALGTYLMNQP